MKDLSNMFHINYTYCCELFKKVMGITFSEYVTGLRMKKAVQLLDNSDLSIEKVAIETGYSDYYYFNNVFKKYYNITPSKYRKSSRN
jgi:YesN/AraC family two-component response regulator